MKIGMERALKIGAVSLVVISMGFMLNGGVCGEVRASERTITVDNDGGGDYIRIQDAINAANQGDTVFVRSATYYGDIDINTPRITLQGESKESTIIYGGIEIKADEVEVMRFTIIDSSRYAISCQDANYVTIKENKIVNGEYGGIRISHSYSSFIINNLIDKNRIGVYLGEGSWYINITGNMISDSPNGGIRVDIESDGYHYIHHNNFIENTPNAAQDNRVGVSYWDNGKEGNYWSDYEGNDTDGDGIGDISYNFRTGIDRYPLMRPWEEKEKRDNIPGFEFIILVISIASLILLKRKK